MKITNNGGAIGIDIVTDKKTINVDKIKSSTERTYVNWVEKTLSDNNLNTNAKIAQVSLYPQTTHLAVFGDRVFTEVIKLK